jgi:hypothetical protein
MQLVPSFAYTGMMPEESVALQVCKGPCGKQKPESDFAYTDGGRKARKKVCRSCSAKAARDRLKEKKAKERARKDRVNARRRERYAKDPAYRAKIAAKEKARTKKRQAIREEEKRLLAERRANPDPDMPELRECRKCGEILEIHFFSTYKRNGEDRYFYTCLDCLAAKKKKWYDEKETPEAKKARIAKDIARKKKQYHEDPAYREREKAKARQRYRRNQERNKRQMRIRYCERKIAKLEEKISTLSRQKQEYQSRIVSLRHGCLPPDEQVSIKQGKNRGRRASPPIPWVLCGEGLTACESLGTCSDSVVCDVSIP